MEIKENTNYEGQNILIKIKGKKDPKVLVKTSAKSAFYSDGDKMRYTSFKNMGIFNGEVDDPISKKSRYGKTYIVQLPLFGGHMPSPPEACKRPQQIFVDARTGLCWIDLNVCTVACKKKCGRWEEYRKERK